MYVLKRDNYFFFSVQYYVEFQYYSCTRYLIDVLRFRDFRAMFIAELKKKIKLI